jgi:translocation and assembly module TamB
MSVRKKIVLLALVALGLLSLVAVLTFLNSKTFTEQLKYQITGRLDQITGGRSSIAHVVVHFFPLRIRIEQLTIPGNGSPLNPPLLSVQRIEAMFSFRGFLGIPQLKSLELVQPRIYFQVNADGSTNFPPLHSPSSGEDLFRLSAEKLTISRGLLQFRENRIGLNGEMDHFALLASYNQPSDTYRAHLAYQNAKVQFGRDFWSHGLDLLAEIGKGEIRIEKLAASAGQSILQADGVLKNLSSPRLNLSYRGFLDPQLAKPFAPQLRGGSGLVSCVGRLEYAKAGWKTWGTLDGGKLSINTVNVDQFSTQYSLSSDRLSFEKIRIRGMHGWTEGSLTVESPFASRLYKADLRLQRIGLLDLSLLARLERLKFGGLLNGNIKAHWRDQWSDFAGEGELKIIEAANEQREHQVNERILPLAGQLNFSLTSSSSSFRNSSLRLGSTSAELAGILSASQTSNLHLRVRSEDLNDINFFIPGLQGTASFEGLLQGRLGSPRISGNFTAEKILYETFFFDNLSGQVEADRSSIRLSETTARRAHSTLLADGTVFLSPGESVPSGAVQFSLRVKEAMAEDLFALLGKTFPTSGLISGDFTVAGRYPELEVRGSGRIRQGIFFDQPYDLGEFEMHYLDPVLTLYTFTVSLGKGQVSGFAELNMKEESIRSNVTAHNLPLDRIRVLNFPDAPITGTLRDLELQANGNLRRPALEGSFTVINSQVAGELAGDFATQFHTANQILKFTSFSLQPTVKLRADGSLSLNENYDFDAKIGFENFIFTPYVKKLLPAASETLTSQANGEVSISGPFSNPHQLSIGGTLNVMKIKFRESQIEASKPFQFQYQDEKVFIKDAFFSGKGTSLKVDGFVDFSRTQRLNLDMTGNFDLALLNEFAKKLRSSGNGKVNAAIRGTLPDPRFQGHAEIANGQFSYGDLPNSLSQVTANIFFDEDQIKINHLSGTTGGGQVSIRGDLIFSHEMVKLIQLQAEAREVRVRYPEGMRNVVNADLTLRGSQKSQLLSGNVRLLSATFQKGYDPITEFLENRKNPSVFSGGKDVVDSLSLDLTLTGDRAIKLDTPVMKVLSSTDLRIRGTMLNPLLTGRIEADTGNLYFQGARYRITRGRIDFVNSARFEPHFDLEAETDVRDYRVILTLNGTADKFKADLHSDPPLSNFDLFSLVSSGGGGGRNAVTGSSWRPYSTSGRQQDSSLGAESVLSEGLSLKMGSRFKRIFGLDRFRVDPFLLGNERDQTARVTFGQQVTKDVAITYSTSFSSTDQQVIIVEYNVNDNTSIIASRDVEGSFGLDVRFRKRLRQKHH